MWRAEAVLGQARALFVDAGGQHLPADRFRIAHLAALRAAAALLLTVDAAGSRLARRPTSAWVLIERLAPDFAPWAQFFAAHAAQRAAADAGADGAVTSADAARMLAAVDTFLALADTALSESAVRRAGPGVSPEPVGTCAEHAAPPRRAQRGELNLGIVSGELSVAS